MPAEGAVAEPGDGGGERTLLARVPLGRSIPPVPPIPKVRPVNGADARQKKALASSRRRTTKPPPPWLAAYLGFEMQVILLDSFTLSVFCRHKGITATSLICSIGRNMSLMDHDADNMCTKQLEE